jgi:hypothetical protein
VYELYLCFVLRFVHGPAHAATPFANAARRGLHDVENLEWNGRAIARAHRASLRLL